MANEFFTWVTTEINNRGWSNSELARRAGISPSTLSLILSGDRNPGLDFCVGIAQAFNEPPETVLRKAGLIPHIPAPEGSLPLQEIWDLVKNMDEAQRLEALNYLRYLYQKVK